MQCCSILHAPAHSSVYHYALLMHARTILGKTCVLLVRRQLAFLSMAPGGQGALVGFPLKRSYTVTTIDSSKADRASILGQPPPTPIKSVLLRRSRRCAVSKTVEHDAASGFTGEAPLASESDIKLEETPQDDQITVRAQAVITGAALLDQPADVSAVATVKKEDALTHKTSGTQQGKPEQKPRAETVQRKRTRVPSAAVIAKAEADLAAAQLPAHPALTLETMPAALQHLRSADPGG